MHIARWARRSVCDASDAREYTRNFALLFAPNRSPIDRREVVASRRCLTRVLFREFSPQTHQNGRASTGADRKHPSANTPIRRVAHELLLDYIGQ